MTSIDPTGTLDLQEAGFKALELERTGESCQEINELLAGLQNQLNAPEQTQPLI